MHVLLAAAQLAATLAGYSLQDPAVERLQCEESDVGYIRARMYDVSGNQKSEVALFEGLGPVGYCEMARRNARGNHVCVFENWKIRAINYETGVELQSFGSYSDQAYRACFDYVNPQQLQTRPGYVDFIDPVRLAPFLTQMPTVADPTIDDALHSADTMWYDDRAFVFTYQDSSGDPIGIRANRVGYDVGFNATHPDIKRLTHYFQFGSFKAPFAVAGGTDNVEDGYVLNFWLPPRNDDGSVIPVPYWIQSNSRWRWEFPEGTIFGEVLFQKAPGNKQWVAYEVRTRTLNGQNWENDIFRPFVQAESMADRITDLRPGWKSDPQLVGLVSHLRDASTLVPYTVDTAPYEALVPPFDGAMDILPTPGDDTLVHELLQGTFESARGQHWKQSGDLVAYAPTAQGGFNIVPANYEVGVVPVEDATCNQCHAQAGVALGNLEGTVIAYGEMWGEDQTFTWHLFDIWTDAFSVSDNSRRVNPRLVNAGLVQKGQP